MVSTKFNLNVEQGATFHVEATLLNANDEPLSVTGFTSNAQIRKSSFSNTAYPFDVTLEDGLITLAMDANTTSELEPGRYVYDVYMYDANSSVRIFEGLVTVSAQVTK
jgi:hypothetical protein